MCAIISLLGIRNSNNKGAIGLCRDFTVQDLDVFPHSLTLELARQLHSVHLTLELKPVSLLGQVNFPHFLS